MLRRLSGGCVLPSGPSSRPLHSCLLPHVPPHISSLSFYITYLFDTSEGCQALIPPRVEVTRTIQPKLGMVVWRGLGSESSRARTHPGPVRHRAPQLLAELCRPDTESGNLAFFFNDLLKLTQLPKTGADPLQNGERQPSEASRRCRVSISDSKPKKLKIKNKTERTETTHCTLTAFNSVS